MTINIEDKNKLKAYGGILSLEDNLRNTQVTQDPRALANVSMGLGNEVLGDPLMAVRMPLPELSLETQRYLEANWNDPNSGYNIDNLITSNTDEILNEYASVVNQKLQKTTERAKKSIEEAGKEWKGLSKETVAYTIGTEIIRTLEPEQLRAISEGSESDKKNAMYRQRAGSRPYLTGNVAFYEDPTQAESLMIRLTGEQFIKEIKPSEEGGIVTYELDKDKLKSYYNINPQKKDDGGNDVLDEEKAKVNRKKYALMALTLQ